MTAATLALPPRYRGAERIASGGMADVYGATDDVLDRRVAIKILGERFADDPETRERFTREARIAARLSTEPHVVTIFDVAEVERRPAIVMEFLSGGTLEDRMRAGRVPPALALAWLGQAAAALDAAHAAGVVHRDVKPANLMLGGDGELRVTDFGIARIAGDVSLTSAGTILGTSGYLSPEQAMGTTATAASDRYSLAVVAFELLAGRRPFVAATFADEAAAHATAPIPAATAFDRMLPPSLDAVLARGMAKEPESRFRSCGELVASLRAAFAESAGTTQRVPAPAVPATADVASAAPLRRHTSRVPFSRVVALALLVGLVLLGLLVAALAGRGGDEAGRATTVLRVETVAGRAQVRTVTVETRTTAAAATQPAPSVASTSAGQSTAAAPSAASLNDQGYRLLQSGNPAGAVPLLERAVNGLQGSGSLTEAYASYNLALARFSTGSCDGVKDLLDRSRQIQGKRHEIDDLEHRADKACKGR
jgi:eukaryotic-like serine/threonine-protein kinase